MGKPGPRPGHVNPASIAALREHGGDPETAALTHQGRRWLGRALAPSCDHCADRGNCEAYTAGGTCSLAEQEQAELHAAVTALPHIRPEQEPLVRAYVRDAVFCEIIVRYLGATSPFLPGADKAAYIEGQPVLPYYNAAVARMLKAADALGLTPAARNRLGLDHDGRPQGIGRLLSAEWGPAVESTEEGSAHADD